MDIIRKNLWLLLIVAAWFCVGWADSFEGIRAAAESVETLRAEFVQEKHLPILARPLISKGAFAFRRPDGLRWEYKEPLRSVLLMHQGRVRRFSYADGRWVEAPSGNMQSMDIVFQEIRNWLNGRFDESAMFSAKLVSSNTIELTPKNDGMGRFIQRIELKMADQPGIMQEVTIIEGPDAYTRIRFLSPKLNPALPDTLFVQAP